MKRSEVSLEDREMSSEEIESSHAIVIDNGSFEIKAGHGSYDSPSVKLMRQIREYICIRDVFHLETRDC